ncbi:MAG: right-handed parallel beta-helix repeat-containing protein [Sphingomonadales bacterium]
MQATHRAALPEGTKVEEFEFHRVLGHGGFGITYLGWDLHLDMPVAIKEFLPMELVVREGGISVFPKTESDREDYEWGLDRFLDEARVLARFKHPNIVQVHRFFRAHGTAYIVMEYAEGETLAEHLDRCGRLPEAEIKSILMPILDGLATVHGASFLHRDIKPGNIIIRDNSSPVLIDFGAARQAIGVKSRSVTSIVTPGYAPIEQYSTKSNQGPWTDIYAMGAVAHKCITGHSPPDAADRVQEDSLEGWRDNIGGYSQPFLDAVNWALGFKQTQRPQSLMEWRAALDGGPVPEYAASRDMDPDRPPPRKEKKKKKVREPGQGSGLKILIAAGLLIAIGVAASVFFWVRGGSGELVVEASFYLEQLGYEPGADTSRLTTRLKNAIKDFESDSGLFQSGKVNERLVARLKEAFEAADNAAWQKALADSSEAAFAEYLQAFPNGLHAAEVNAARDEAAWSKARSAGTAAAYEKYQREFPNGAHVAEVGGRIDDAAWAEARAAGTEAALDRYLRNHPSGKHVAEVGALKDEIAWKRADAAGTRAGFQAYKRAYPAGLHLAEADRRIQQIDLTQLVRAVQQELRRLGYLQSRADGVLGQGTITAIRAFQSEKGFVTTGQPSQTLLDRLKAAQVKSIWTVAKDGSGDFTTINAALDRVPDGGRVRIMPGIYRETIRLSRTVHLEGVGNLRDVVIETSSSDTIVIRGGSGSITNLTARVTGSERGINVINSLGGSWTFEGNDFSDSASTIIFVTAGRPVFRNNAIHDSPWNGINVKGNAQPLIEGNRIYALKNPAVWIGEDAVATIRNNTLYNIPANGIYFGDQARGIVENNDISGTEFAALWIGGSANPEVRSNRIHDLPSNGIQITEQATGTFEDNEIWATGKPAIWVGGTAAPTVSRNQIHDISGNAVNISGTARGTFRFNRIWNAGNVKDRFPAVFIGKDANVLFSNNEIFGSGNNQIYMETGGLSTVENNDVRQ